MIIFDSILRLVCLKEMYLTPSLLKTSELKYDVYPLSATPIPTPTPLSPTPTLNGASARECRAKLYASDGVPSYMEVRIKKKVKNNNHQNLSHCHQPILK